MRAATKVYSLSSGKGKSEWHRGITVTVRHGGSLSALCTHVFIHASAHASKSNRREPRQPRVDARDAVPYGRKESLRLFGAN
jgi:hypothetical protein